MVRADFRATQAREEAFGQLVQTPLGDEIGAIDLNHAAELLVVIALVHLLHNAAFFGQEILIPPYPASNGIDKTGRPVCFVGNN